MGAPAVNVRACRVFVRTNWSYQCMQHSPSHSTPTACLSECLQPGSNDKSALEELQDALAAAIRAAQKTVPYPKESIYVRLYRRCVVHAACFAHWFWPFPRSTMHEPAQVDDAPITLLTLLADGARQ